MLNDLAGSFVAALLVVVDQVALDSCCELGELALLLLGGAQLVVVSVVANLHEVVRGVA